jgi:hypothetical protein
MDLDLGKLSQKKYFKYFLFSIIGGAAVASVFLYEEKLMGPITEVKERSINIEEKYPRLANLFLKWNITEAEAIELAKWDLVVIDMEAQVRTPEGLRKIREYNPNIKILAYITSQEFTSSFYTLRSDSMRRRLYSDFSDDWWLKTSGGGRTVWWPGTWLINVTNAAASNKNGQKWNDYLPEFVSREILSTGFWDGVFYDNAWEGASWLPSGKELDINRDGKNDSGEEIDRKWREGMNKIFEKTRELSPGKIVMGNGGKTYAENLNGIAIEHFHRMDWSWGMNDYFTVLREDQDPETMIFACNTENSGRSDDYQKMRYCLASALLGDGYFAFDYGDQAHNYTWWYDEYDISLGKPLGNAYNIFDKKDKGTTKSVWRRDFEKGIVLVNSTGSPSTVNLEENFNRIYGNQDRRTNNGATIRSIEIPAQDGIILLRRDNIIQVNNFINNSLTRIFDSEGNLKEDSFFIYYEKYDLGSNVVIDDLDNDGEKETVVASGGRVEIFNKRGVRTAELYPYGKDYGQGINFALGDFNQDGKKEIIVGPKGKIEPLVKIFNKSGGVINKGFLAYDSKFRGGVNVALGDLDRDSWPEIITGAGKGGGPHIRIFSGGGKLIHPGFFAYGKLTRGGVTVALADVNNDKKEEIITGSGFGLDAEVKIFSLENKNFRLKKYFKAFELNKSGVIVNTSDYNNDGKEEILVSSSVL